MSNFLTFSVAIFNNLRATEKCIRSIESTVKNEAYEVLIYDNNSTDQNLLSFYKTLNKDVYKVHLGNNNIGYKTAHKFNASLDFGGDFFIIINNDLEFLEPNWNRKLRQVYTKDTGIIGLKGPEVRNALTTAGRGYVDNRVKAPWYIEGMFMAIPRDVLKKEGLFNNPEIQFCYSEDTDYSFELQSKGYVLKQIEIKFNHEIESTLRLVSEDLRKKIKSQQSLNHAALIKKWRPFIESLRNMK